MLIAKTSWVTEIIDNMILRRVNHKKKDILVCKIGSR